MVHIMQYPRWAPRGNEGWAPHPPALGKGRAWRPPGAGEAGKLQLQNWGEGQPGEKLAQTDALWTRSAVPLDPARPYRTLCIY